MGPIAIELFEPIYFPILEKFLETHGEGIWHFGYSVSRKQFDSTIAELKKKGIEVTGHSEYKNGVRMAFLDPCKTGVSYFSCTIAHQKWKTSLIQWAWYWDKLSHWVTGVLRTAADLFFARTERTAGPLRAPLDFM